MATQVKHISGVSTEQHITTLLEAGDKYAVTLIFQHYAPAMSNIIRRILKDVALVEDVLQESLVKIWQNSRSFDPSKGALFTWLVRICRNTAIDKTRSRDFRNTEKSKQAVDIVSIAEDRGEENDLERLYMRQLIGQLSENYRKLIDLAYFQGYTQKEIAENLDMPLGTVKTRIRMALKQLKAII